MRTADLEGELCLELFRVFRCSQVLQTLSHSDWLTLWFILASKNVSQQVDIGELFSDWTRRGSMAFCPQTTIVSFQQLHLLQGVVRLRPTDREGDLWLISSLAQETLIQKAHLPFSFWTRQKRIFVGKLFRLGFCH